MKAAMIMFGAAALLAGAANAEPIVVTTEALPTQRVSFEGLDLGSAAGRNALERRIRSAAEQVCSRDGDRSLKTTLIVRGCYTAAVQDGLRQMDAVLADHRNGIQTVTATLTIAGQ